MKNLCRLLFLVFIVGMFSCTSEQELVVDDSEVEFLKTYIDKADSYSFIADEFNTDASEIFDAVVFSVDCNGGGASLDIQQEGRQLLNQLMRLLDFQTPRQIHNWVVENGKLIYDLRMSNMSIFNNENEFIHELACTIVPEIRTRTDRGDCYKENVISFLKNSLAMGRTYGVNFNRESDNREVTDVVCVARGSALNKLWNYFTEVSNCE